MSTSESDAAFARRIEERKEHARSLLEREHEAMQARMLELERRQQFFDIAAEKISELVVLPRMTEFANSFDNADVRQTSRGYSVTCDLEHCTRFPSTANISFTVGHDEEFEHVDIHFAAQILPVFTQFERAAVIRFDLHSVDDDRAIAWVEERLLGFLDSYLPIEFDERYQAHNMVIDPVCGMRIMRTKALVLERDGITYYFCAQICRDRFENDADADITTHQQS